MQVEIFRIGLVACIEGLHKTLLHLKLCNKAYPPDFPALCFGLEGWETNLGLLREGLRWYMTPFSSIDWSDVFELISVDVLRFEVMVGDFEKWWAEQVAKLMEEEKKCKGGGEDTGAGDTGAKAQRIKEGGQASAEYKNAEIARLAALYRALEMERKA